MELYNVHHSVIFLSIGLFHSYVRGGWISSNERSLENNIHALRETKFEGSLSNKYYMSELCKEKQNVTVQVKGSEAYSAGVLDLKISSDRSATPAYFKCMVTVEAEFGYNLLVHVHSYSIAFGEDRCPRYLAITEERHLHMKLCNKKSLDELDESFRNSLMVTSIKGRKLSVNYVNTQHANFDDRFSITFTAFKKVVSGKKCPGFLCDNSNCISSLFKSDGRNNCGDWSDEGKNESFYFENVQPNDSDDSDELETSEIVGISLGAVGIVALFLIAFAIHMYRQKSKDTSSNPVTVEGKEYNSWNTALPHNANSNANDKVFPEDSDIPLTDTAQLSNAICDSEKGKYIGDKTEDLSPTREELHKLLNDTNSNAHNNVPSQNSDIVLRVSEPFHISTNLPFIDDEIENCSLPDSTKPSISSLESLSS